MRYLSTIFVASLFGLSAFADVPNLFSSPKESYEVICHNRPLVKIHGKMFSVLDVQKKMDLFLQENNPESFSSSMLRFQFYTQNWRAVLQEMINNELIMMEAEEFKINISDGDVREGLEKRFGPNLIQRLDELSLSMEDAKTLIRDDMIVRNMSYYRIWSKVLHEVTPEVVKSEYSDYITEAPQSDEWVYKVVSLRGENETSQIATTAYNLLKGSKDHLLDSKDVIQVCESLPATTSLTLSEPITMRSKEIAPDVLKVLETLPIGTVSEPLLQKSRADGSSVYRMFSVVDHKQASPPPFEELSPKIYDLLVQKRGEIQREEYFERLRKRFCHEDLVVKTMFQANYQPFTICGT